MSIGSSGGWLADRPNDSFLFCKGSVAKSFSNCSASSAVRAKMLSSLAVKSLSETFPSSELLKDADSCFNKSLCSSVCGLLSGDENTTIGFWSVASAICAVFVLSNFFCAIVLSAPLWLSGWTSSSRSICFFLLACLTHSTAKAERSASLNFKYCLILSRRAGLDSVFNKLPTEPVDCLFIRLGRSDFLSVSFLALSLLS